MRIGWNLFKLELLSLTLLLTACAGNCVPQNSASIPSLPSSVKEQVGSSSSMSSEVQSWLQDVQRDLSELTPR